MSKALTVAIEGIMIRTDSAGRYSFNDLHAAAVAAGHDYKVCQVSNFTRQESTAALIAELLKSEELAEPWVSTPGRYGGSWGCKELVYAYAMWISPSFHLKVIRSYDASVSRVPVSLDEAVDTALNDPVFLRKRLLINTEKVIELTARVEVMTPKVEAFERVASSDGSHGPRDAAAILGVPERELIEELMFHSWCYRRVAGGPLLPNAEARKAGVVEMKLYTHEGPDGKLRERKQFRITAYGMTRLADRWLVKWGLLPKKAS